MKFPESWLREHVHVQANSSQLCDSLTAIGLEVEEARVIGADLKGIVVAEIISAEKHPEADRLRVCQVSYGAGETVQIVCGAPNARAGLKAPLATVGAVLPGGLQIKSTKLRGVESFGMLCSGKELGLDEDADGLFELAADAVVGNSIESALALPDTLIELKLTPNRADCFSVRGIAYDVAAALDSRVEAMQIAESSIESDRTINIELDAQAACPRYCGRFIEAVNPAAKTPVWMAERLRRSGIRPISVLVDVTAYVMLELGQPMHAFDAAKISGPIGVRWAKPGEKIKLLDEREVTLDPKFLCITDNDQPVALGGVMGGWDSRVTEATTHVFLEAAHFAPDAIVGRARKLGMHTDASHRFERGVDPALPALAMERATRLIQSIMGGKASAIIEAVLPQHLPEKSQVLLRRDRLTRVLGVEVADAKVEQILRALGMQVTADAKGWMVKAPLSRFDIAIEEDLIEEVARIHGYEHIPVHLPRGAIGVAMNSEQQSAPSTLRRVMVARDFVEAINYAFIDPSESAKWGFSGAPVQLANPLASDLALMRPSLLPGLLAALRRNLARQMDRVRLFELGRVFQLVDGAPLESQRIAAVVCGSALPEQWSEKQRSVDFYDLKADVQALLAVSNLTPEFRASTQAWAHPGKSADIYLDGALMGHLGALHPLQQKQLDVDAEVYLFELDLAALQQRQLPRAQAISKYPAVRRDLALIVPEATEWGALEQAIKRVLGARLKNLLIFDQYRGKGLEPETKSLAMGLILQEVSRTLEDHDIEESVAKVLNCLRAEFGAELRG